MRGLAPILDRVKTALFDILRPRIAGMTVLDLFAGSGSVGIEALSQGAAHCTFIDRGHKAVATIKKNLEATGLGDRADVLHGDALGYLKATTKTFDFIYVAPPQYKGLWLEAMRLVGRRLAAPSEEAPKPKTSIKLAWQSRRLIRKNTRALISGDCARCGRSGMGTRCWCFTRDRRI